MQLTRRHHPLEGERLDVLIAGPTQIVVRLRDGSSMRLPRAWTDAAAAPPTKRVERVFSADALRELIARVDLTRRRA